MSSANKQTALAAAHRAPRKRPFRLRFRRPEPRVFWAFPACSSFSASPLCPEFFTFPAYLKISVPHQAPRKRPFYRCFRQPEPRVFWAFQRGVGFSVFPTYLEFSAPHRFTFPACPNSSVSPALLEFSVSPARTESSTRHCFISPVHPEHSAPHQSPRKRPFHGRFRRPGARVFWAFQRGADFSVSPPCPDFSAFPAHPAPDASGALFRRAVLRGEHPGCDQPFGAHAS